MATRFQAMPPWLQRELLRIVENKMGSALRMGTQPHNADAGAEGRSDWDRINEAVRWLSEEAR